MEYDKTMQTAKRCLLDAADLRREIQTTFKRAPLQKRSLRDALNATFLDDCLAHLVEFFRETDAVQRRWLADADFRDGLVSFRRRTTAQRRSFARAYQLQQEPTL